MGEASEAAEFRAAQEEQWDNAAPAWNKWWRTPEERFARVSDWMIEAAGIGPGSRVLDVACGIGEPALTAAQKVGADGFVLGADNASRMLEFARADAEKLGLSNTEFRHVPGEALDFQADPFDAVLCRWGLMFMTDIKAAVGGVHRHLVDGGTYVAAVWGAPQDAPALSLPVFVLDQFMDVPEPPPGQPGMFALADPTPAQRALEEVGFKETRVESVEFESKNSSGEEYASFVREVSAPIAAMVAEFPPDKQNEIWAKVAEVVTEKFGKPDGSISVPMKTLAIVAKK